MIAAVLGTEVSKEGLEVGPDRLGSFDSISYDCRRVYHSQSDERVYSGSPVEISIQIVPTYLGR